MHIPDSINMVELVVDEVALEGLDGITLEALWQRLGVKLGESLPLKFSFMEQIWKICLELRDFTFYELENRREKLIIFDRYELEYLNTDLDKEYEHKDIYLYCPIEDTNNGIRGSCSTYYTRKDISDQIKDLSLSEVGDKYGQKFVIVAAQNLREAALIDSDVRTSIQLPLAHYCLLERIGRARRIGEITIKKSSSIKEDAKALFYIRKGLQSNGLIRKQVYYQGNTGLNHNGQNTGTLVHLTRFFNTRKPKVIIWAEHLINYLKSKENYVAEYNEVKSELNLDYSIKKFFKINLLQKVFRTDVKVPYRTYFPNCLEKEWQVKNNPTKERIIKLVTLTDPNIEISDLWRTEEVNDDDDQYQLDIKDQKICGSYLRQIQSVLDSKEYKGASQTELATEMGFTKLISRTLVRNLVKAKTVSTYLDDIGRQRTTKFVSRKFDAKSSVKKQLEEEICKIKEYSRSIPINENIEEKLSDNTNNEDNCQSIIENNSQAAKSVDEINISINDNSNNNDFKCHLFKVANNIFKKYRTFKSKTRYQYTSSKTCKRLSGLKKLKKDVNNKESIKKDDFNDELEDVSDKEDENIMDSDFYKTVETNLIVQKPECKKKSQKIAVVGFMENVHNCDANKNLTISYRLLRRANLVIERVKEHKVIQDTQKLMKYINTEEDKEGLDAKIDKNSLIRLLQKLAEDNFIKCITLVLRNQTKQKVVNFICDPTIDVNDTVIQSAVEQAKLKFCVVETSLQKTIENTDKTFLPNNNTNLSHERKADEKLILQKDNRFGKKYGYSPKFIRMKTMHIFLYYLIYDHSAQAIPYNTFVGNLKREGFTYDDIFDNTMNVYSIDINWKMFISPLPKHRGYTSGWALMCDILLRMPLSVFVKVHNINFEVPRLQHFLDHPIKKHYLIKDMPAQIRNLLFANRKYIFSIHEIVTRLCYLGLVQFGPQMLKEKDQVFIYLNRHTELLDTTSSAAGYHRVEDKPYPVTKYKFTSMAVVETYWYEMWNTCINTCLGGRSVVEGKDILLEDLSRKAEMIQALKVRQVHEAAKYDTGFVPGDRKGAAGIDSAFFPHLKRNWNWVSTNQSTAMKKANSRPLQSVKTVKTSPRTSSIQTRKTPQPRKRSNPLKPNQTKTSSNERKSSELAKPQVKVKREAGLLQFPTVSCSKPPKIIRKVMPRKPMLRKRVKYDEIDYSALQRMDKLRVDWEQHEDNILLVCKVAMVYLCPNPRRNLVNFTAIRDILRSYSFTSYNKTSRACQRRLLYMLKQPKTLNSVLLGVEEVKQDYFVNKRFGGLVDSVRGESEDPMDYEKRVEKVFKDLVTYIAKKYYNISNMEQREPEALPKTIQEFNLFYKLQLPTKTITTPRISKEVREVNDIHIATINSVIHSSMCCGKERRSWAYQLFKVYQQYPEYLLRSAMLKIRADQMVTMKKNYTSAFKKFGNCMPMSSSQYQLSSAYYYKFQTKWPYEIFSESYDILYSLLDNYAHRTESTLWDLEMKPNVGGVVATVHDFISTDHMNVDIDIPDQIIMLDPGLLEKDEVYQRIALRYETILKGLNSDFLSPSQGLAQNTVEISRTSQDNLNNLDQASINEQQSFVNIRSAKRPGEHDFHLPQAKKQKLDNETSRPTVETDNERNKTAIGNFKEEIQSTIEMVSVIENSCIIDDRDEKFLALVECDKSTSNFDVTEQIIPSVEKFDTNNQTVPCKNLSAIESNNINVSSSTSEPVGDNNKYIEPLVENASINIQSITNESVVNDKYTLESTNIVVNSNKESESSTKDASDGKKKNIISSDSQTSESTKISFTRVSDLMKRVNSRIATEDVGARVEVQDVRTRQTRIAMLKMREELHDLTFQDSHHAHEYFVVNSFKLFYSLTTRPEVKDSTDVTDYRGMDLPRKLLPIDIGVANKVLEDVKKFAVFPKYPLPYDDLEKEITDNKIFEWGQVDSIYKFVKDKAEFGATLHELVMNFGYLNNVLADILLMLSEKRLVLRAGIVTVRYIHYRYINPWIIHSYKILRLDKEAHQTVPEGSVYILDNEDSIDTEKDAKRVTTAANLFYSSPIKSSTNEIIKRAFNSEKEPLPDSKEVCVNETTRSDTNVQTEVNEAATQTKTSPDENSSQVEKAEDADDSTKNPKRLRRNRTVLLKQKDIYRAAKLLDFNTAEEIKVVIKPWIRIDGVLNRRVLDRMLGAVLCYCIERPGACLTIIQNRFIPAIQPYHTRELIEILVKLGCLRTSVQKVPKVTLFSKPAKLVSNGNPDLVAVSDSIIIEPTQQATLKFGMFLSNRSYSLDFLSSL